MAMRDAFIAVNRFGLGAREGELREAAADPRGWVKAQILSPINLPAALSEFPSSNETVAAFLTARKQARKSGDKAMLMAKRKAIRNTYVEEAATLIKVRIETEAPVVERLTAFWSNHFTVSVRKPIVTGIAGAFEREAIRPHVLGRFSDMLLSVVRHPAMLAYLDNIQSIGPNSIVGKRRDKGLNENLAREVLELHTLGVDGGYTQADVREFAKILTGWSVSRGDRAGSFKFHVRAHEPGAKILLGKRYLESGADEGRAALNDLARHPATARHIAFKLARHFAADQPPDGLVDRLAAVFRETDGNLRAMSEALVASWEAWETPLPKVKAPSEFVVSAMRAIEYRGEPRRLYFAMRLLGQAPYTAPSPAGWPDEAEKWISPHPLLQRAELAMRIGRWLKGSEAAERLLSQTIGPVMMDATRAAVIGAPDEVESVATLFASPEFQRR